jgi:predicted regulator of Ras-like GTPase activity (Roadblock/LC7/MglB family)
MSPLESQESALQQLAGVPGVVGSLVFDERGAVVASAFPPVFDAAGLRSLARRLSEDGYYQQWMAGEGGALELRFADGNVALRTVDRSWLLVLSTAQANPQLLSMSLTQVVRRLRVPGAAPGEAAPAAAAEPSAIDRLRAIVKAELGEHATQALEILAAAGTKPRGLVRAAEEVEKLTRMFISRKKADELGRRMREILGE